MRGRDPISRVSDWERRNRLLIRHVRQWTTFVLCFLTASASQISWIVTGRPKYAYSFATMMALGSIGGIVAMLLSTSRAQICERPLDRLDLARMISWSVVGCGFGSGVGYNPFGWQIIIAGLLFIGISSLFPSPIRPAQPTMCCSYCGYNLTGLIEPRCPECGKNLEDTPGS